MQDKYGSTALMNAASFGDEEDVSVLLDRGADVTITNNEGETALMIARGFGADKIIRLLNNEM